MTTPYCDYPYYQGTFLGNQISETDFPRLALRASAVVDQVTFKRAITETDPDNVDAIKMATCAIAETIQMVEAEGSLDGIVSETTGRHSVTYSENSSRQNTSLSRYSDAAALYLGGTGLMFTGFRDGELG